jgi:flavin reductase (DIM6/NTAB) family NADH-FMN oxidoreductase RutF
MKTKLGAKLSLYPMPIVLVGAVVNGKPNYTTIAHVGIMDMHSVSISSGKSHYINAGIKENKTFSLNIPPENLVKETDFCGIVSGKNTDKTRFFKTFYGDLKTAPMIEECAINMECRLAQTVDFPSHDVFVGEIVQTHCGDEFLKDGVIDFGKIRPILFVFNDASYWRLGLRLGQAWSIGKEFKR